MARYLNLAVSLAFRCSNEVSATKEYLLLSITDKDFVYSTRLLRQVKREANRINLPAFKKA